MKETRHKIKYIVGIYLYKVQRQTKIICNVGNKDSIYLWDGTWGK